MERPGLPPARMKVVCAWCGGDLGWIEAHPRYANRITHGICAPCRTAYGASEGPHCFDRRPEPEG